MEDGILIRRGTEADLESIIAIGLSVWVDTYSPQGLSLGVSQYLGRKFSVHVISALLSSDDCAFFMAEKEGRVVGYTLLKRHVLCPLSEDLDVEVARGAQSLGIGGKLFRTGLEFAVSEWGSDRCWLRMSAKNLAAKKFYASHGFEPIGSILMEFDGAQSENYLLASKSHAAF
jgi:ribosomal protein S18 acetylase RimI-like enzyme